MRVCARCKSKYLIFQALSKSKSFTPELKFSCRRNNRDSQQGLGKEKASSSFLGEKLCMLGTYFTRGGFFRQLDQSIVHVGSDPSKVSASRRYIRLHLERYLTLPHPFAAIRDKDRLMTQTERDLLLSCLSVGRGFTCTVTINRL